MWNGSKTTVAEKQRGSGALWETVDDPTRKSNFLENTAYA